MKILAIRGRNLTSLQGNFDLDFTSEPLHGCGLFAITGETGAGKSTILDAMCLALYGRYPRISTGGGKYKVANIKGEALATSDPRSILRTGCADAYAKVDLMVGDKTLQASWRVRRAYDKAHGNLLDFERSLIDLEENSVLASGKKRVDEEITERLKLTYEQFGRTVILAQNDFDAFLRATDTDRADLLEKITGTELYSKLSIKAYENERQAFADLEALQRESGYIAILPKEERSALQKLIKSSELNHQELRHKGQKTRAVLDWYARHDEAVKRLDQAQKQGDLAEQKLIKAADEKQLLAKIDQAQSVQSLIDKAAQETHKLAELHSEQSSEIAKKKELQQIQRKAEEEEQCCRKRFAQSEQILKNALASFERALELDTRISSSLNQQEEIEKQLISVRKTRADLQKQQTRQERAVKLMSERLDVLRSALSQEAAIERITKREQDLHSLFLTLIDLRAKRDHLSTLHLARQQSNEALGNQLQRNSEQIQDRRDRLAKARLTRDEKRKKLDKTKPHEARQRRDQQADYQNQLTSLHHHLERIVEQTALIDKTDKTRFEAQASMTKAGKELQSLETELNDLKSRDAEAQEALTRSKSALSKQVLSLRADLRPDEPCLVCGSTDHPGQDDEAVQKLLELMRSRAKELAKKISRNEKQRVRIARVLEHSKARHESAGDRYFAATSRLDELQIRTENLLQEASRAAKCLGHELGEKRPPEQFLAHIFELRNINEHHMIDGRKQLLVIQQLEAQCRASSEKVTTLEKELQTQLEENDELVGAGQKSGNEVREMEVRLGQVAEHFNLVLDQLHMMLGDADVAKEDLERDPESIEQHVKKQVARFKGQYREAEQIETDLQKSRKEGAVQAEKCEHMTSRCAELAQQLQSALNRLTAQQGEREKIFDGAPVVTIRTKMEEACKRDNKALQEALGRRRESTTRLDILQKNLVRLDRQIETTGRSEQKLQIARDAGLQKKGLQLAKARSLLAIPHKEVQAMRKMIDQLEQDNTKCAALLLDRKRNLDDLQQHEKPLSERSDILSQLKEIEADQAMLMIDLGKNRSMLELDDEALKQRKKISGKIEQIEAKHVLWAAVSGAIGSKTGDKFRRFAQGVTLDHLIALANQQLRTINPRYKIERNSMGGLGLQVMDIEMGGEIRSVRSLSGGERFLVSLALALGLSQLDGRASFVDTLMIDEGFGTLDARSLDIVMEALESLQSQGRKVGVISHIEALTERIPVQVRVEKQGNGRSRLRLVERGRLV